MEELSDIQILEYDIGGMMLKDATALTFLAWLSKKINGLTVTNGAAFNELRTAVAAPPIAPRIADETKIRYVRKLLELGVQL